MLGPQVALAENIEKAISEKDIAESKYKEKSAKLDEYNDPKNKNSPKFYRNQILQNLKGDENWAGRDRKIKNANRSLEKNQKLNTQVSGSVIEKVLQSNPDKTEEELYKEYYKV